MKTSELISQLLKDYDCTANKMTLQFKSEKDMIDAADDIANAKPFIIDQDDLTLTFLSESAIKVANNAYQIYQNLDELSITKIAKSMQLNESEEIIAMSKGLYNDVNKRTLCAHLGINDLMSDDSTNDIDTANAPELAQVANESHIHTVKFKSFEDAEKSANTKGVKFANAKFNVIGKDDSPKSRYNIADLVTKSGKVIGIIKYNQETKLATIELEDSVSKDSIFDTYVNESAEELKLEVSIKYAKQANDALNDAKNINANQIASNAWTIDIADKDDIDELFKQWNIKEYEFVNESAKTYAEFVAKNTPTPININNVQVGYVLGYKDTVCEVVDIDNNALICNVKVSSNPKYVVGAQLPIFKTSSRIILTKLQDSFVNESSANTKIYETRSAITKILLNSKLNNNEMLETLEPLVLELKVKGNLKTWLTIKDTMSLNESNAPEVFAKKREIEDKLKNTNLSEQERRQLEDLLYQVNSNIGRHNLNESSMKSIIDKKFWVKPFDLVQGQQYTWFMGAEPLICTYVGMDLEKGGFNFKLGKSNHRLSGQDVKDYIFALEYMNESSKYYEVGKLYKLGKTNVYAVKSLAAYKSSNYKGNLKLDKASVELKTGTIVTIVKVHNFDSAATIYEVKVDNYKDNLFVRLLPIDLGFAEEIDDVNESAVAYMVPRSAFANPWLTHKIQSASWIRPYEFGNAFNDGIVNAEVACAGCVAEEGSIETATDIKAVYVNESNEICFAPAVPAYISENGQINSADEFKEYAKVVLKEAHGDDYDESIADKTISGILDKYDNNYGAMIGALTSGFGK